MTEIKKMRMPRTRKMQSRGAYVLHLRVTRDLRLTVGALGDVSFPAGRYLYVGSARKGIAKRTERHRLVASGKRAGARWHIDSLLVCREVRLIRIEPFPGLTECTLSERIARTGNVDAPAPGFGATDCASGCAAHLYRRK